MSRFKDIETVGVCIRNCQMIISMLKSLESYCAEEDAIELLPHVNEALVPLDKIKGFFVGRQTQIMQSVTGVRIPVRFVGKDNIRLIVDNTRKERQNGH